MRTQGEARFTGCWNRRAGSATEELIAAITKERGLDRGIIPNSQNSPKYSLTTSWVIGALILLSMLSGIAVGMWGNYAH